MRKGQALSLLFFGLIVLALTAAKVDTQSALGRLNLSVIVPAQVTLQQETKSYQSAQSYFQTRCVMCHGKGGAGDETVSMLSTVSKPPGEEGTACPKVTLSSWVVERRPNAATT